MANHRKSVTTQWGRELPQGVWTPCVSGWWLKMQGMSDGEIDEILDPTGEIRRWCKNG